MQDLLSFGKKCTIQCFMKSFVFKCFFFGVILSMVNTFVLGQTFNSYHIGNSLTWDANPPAITDISSQAGYAHTVGYHIRTSKALDYMWNNPTDADVTPVEPYGTYTNALPNYTWDAVTLQPYTSSDGTSTLGSQKTAILDMIDLALQNQANVNTQFYIYAAYPARDVSAGEPDGFDMDYSQKWLTPSAHDLNEPTVLSRQYYQNLLQEVNSNIPAEIAPVKIIPVGEVIYQLEQKMKNGEISGYESAEDLYRDQHHLDNVGRFVAGTTFFATMFDEDPTALPASFADRYLPDYDNFNGIDGPILPGLADVIQTTSWEVVSNPVPEPGSIALLTLGGIWGMRRKKS